MNIPFKSIALALLVALTLSVSCTVVESGTVGVLKRIGAVQPHPLREGFHFVPPFISSVVKYNVKLVNVEETNTASSKDLQAVQTVVAVQYSLSPNLAPKMVQLFGDPEAIHASVMSPAIRESVRGATAVYTAEELVTQRPRVKAAISDNIIAYVNKTLIEKDCLGAIKIANVAVTDFHFSKEFNEAIESKVKAEQEALKAENEKRTRITQAEAEAAERRTSADSIAYKTEVESKARAEAIARESKALEANPNLVQLRIAERWDGKLPEYTGGGVPLLQIKAQ